MESRDGRICRYFHAGQVIQLVSPQRALFAEVLACSAERVTARPEGAAPDAERVLVRAPLKSALLQASARISTVTGAEEKLLTLETFANMRLTERRAGQRLNEPVSTHVHTDHGAFHRIAALNIGAHGAMLGWPDRPEVALGERVRLDFALGDRRVLVTGEVIRLSGCQSAVRFLELSSADESRIAAYVFRQEVTE